MTKQPKRLLILSNVRWDYLWQRQQSLALAAVADGWSVTYVDPHLRGFTHLVSALKNKLRFPRVEPMRNPLPLGLDVAAHPKLVGVKTLRRSPSRSLLRDVEREPRFDLALAYLPTHITLQTLDYFAPTRVVYDRVVDWATAPASFRAPREFQAVENELYERARSSSNWHVVTDNETMQMELRQLGIDAQTVLPATDAEFLGVAPFERERKGIGFFGAVREEIDLQLICECAAIADTIVVGNVDPVSARTLRASGVAVRQAMPLAELAPIVASWAVVLLPYKGERGRTLSPAKLFNSFASGATVATRGLDLPYPLSESSHRLPADNHGALEMLIGLVNDPSAAASVELPTWAKRWDELKKHTEL